MLEQTAAPTAPGALLVEPVALDMLRLLHSNPQYSQRQLSAELGVSLGRVHYVLKALLARGWVKSQNFRRSDNKLGYLYILTPTGVRRRMQMARSFLAIKEAEYEDLRRQIAMLREEVAGGEEPTADGL
jgi:EPS-associated MarR family transcriptional regulator